VVFVREAVASPTRDGGKKHAKGKKEKRGERARESVDRARFLAVVQRQPASAHKGGEGGEKKKERGRVEGYWQLAPNVVGFSTCFRVLAYRRRKGRGGEEKDVMKKDTTMVRP